MISSTTVKANNTVKLEKGNPAPYTGVLFTEPYAQQVRKELIELDQKRIEVESKSKEIKSLNHIITLKNEEIDAYKKQNNRLEKATESSERMKYIYFGLGILATGAAIYTAKGLVK